MSELAIFGGEPVNTEPWPKWPNAGERERELVEEVLSSDLWGGTGFGPKITELNDRFAGYCGVKYGVSVCNGTVSMELTLAAWGIGHGDEVIVPAATFGATPIAVHRAGATVVYVDIDPKTLNLDPEKTSAAISDKTRAIIPVHIGGHPVDMDPIMEITSDRGIKVLEDAAQSHGAIYKRRKVGSLGDAASFSFQQSKNMQSGEGGIVVSNDKELIDIINYSLSKFGRGIRNQYFAHIHHRLASNASYTEIQAAIALAQLERLEEQTELRAKNAKRLYAAMEEIKGIEPLTWQPYCDRHGHHLVIARFVNENFEGIGRSQFLAALSEEGIPCSSFYPMPLWKQPMYKNDRSLKYRETSCPVTEAACREIIFFEQALFLAEPERVDLIGEAMKKVREHAGELGRLDVDEKELMGSTVLKKAKQRASA